MVDLVSASCLGWASEEQCSYGLTVVLSTNAELIMETFVLKPTSSTASGSLNNVSGDPW